MGLRCCGGALLVFWAAQLLWKRGLLGVWDVSCLSSALAAVAAWEWQE